MRFLLLAKLDVEPSLDDLFKAKAMRLGKSSSRRTTTAGFAIAWPLVAFFSGLLHGKSEIILSKAYTDRRGQMMSSSTLLMCTIRI